MRWSKANNAPTVIPKADAPPFLGYCIGRRRRSLGPALAMVRVLDKLSRLAQSGGDSDKWEKSLAGYSGVRDSEPSRAGNDAR